MYLVPVNLAPQDVVNYSPAQCQRCKVLQRAWHCALPGQEEAEMRSEAVNSPLAQRSSDFMTLSPLHIGLLSMILFEESERQRRRRRR